MVRSSGLAPSPGEQWVDEAWPWGSAGVMACGLRRQGRDTGVTRPRWGVGEEEPLWVQ